MNRYADNDFDVKSLLKKVGKWAAIGIVAFIVLLMAGCPYYNVWQQGMAGKSRCCSCCQHFSLQGNRYSRTKGILTKGRCNYSMSKTGSLIPWN